MNMFRLTWKLGKQFSLKLPVRIWDTVLEDRGINDGLVYFSTHNINMVTNVLIPRKCSLMDRNFSQCIKMTELETAEFAFI